ncbi:MAG TPA: ABC transporter permease [Polyangiaceae bacterium]|nr:ABC transporter permease [Polyangiaceae bacterium]HMR78727.1 ABC transporter permease [Polyangiaceae bacterium]
MTQTLLIARRELFAYFRSPLGAVVIAGVLLIDGIYFYWKGLTEKLLSAQVLQEFFFGASGTTMIAAIVLSMRLLAEERQLGTITLLNTSPVRDGEIVMGKFVSAFGVVALMTGLTIYMPLLILVNGKVSGGHIAVGYLGLLLLGAASVAIGLFASALARSQVVALILGALIMAPMLLLWALARAVDPPFNGFLSALSLHHENFRPFMVGILELGAVAYYVLVTYFFLLAATKTLEARRWR